MFNRDQRVVEMAGLAADIAQVFSDSLTPSVRHNLHGLCGWWAAALYVQALRTFPRRRLNRREWEIACDTVATRLLKLEKINDSGDRAIDEDMQTGCAQILLLHAMLWKSVFRNIRRTSRFTDHEKVYDRLYDVFSDPTLGYSEHFHVEPYEYVEEDEDPEELRKEYCESLASMFATSARSHP